MPRKSGARDTNEAASLWLCRRDPDRLLPCPIPYPPPRLLRGGGRGEFDSRKNSLSVFSINFHVCCWIFGLLVAFVFSEKPMRSLMSPREGGASKTDLLLPLSRASNSPLSECVGMANKYGKSAFAGTAMILKERAVTENGWNSTITRVAKKFFGSSFFLGTYLRFPLKICSIPFLKKYLFQTPVYGSGRTEGPSHE